MSTGPSIGVEDLPLYLQAEDPSGNRDANVSLWDGMTLEDVERELIRKALEKVGGNATKAADLLGITRRTLGYRREKYQL